MTTVKTENADLIDVLEKTLSRSPEPLAPGKIAKQLTGPFKAPRQTVAEILADLAEQGRVHEFAPYRTKEKRYWTQDVNVYVRQILLKLLSAKSLTRSELKGKGKSLLRGISESRVTSIFNDLLDAHEIRKLPPYIGARTERFSIRPADVSEYTDHAVEKLTEKLGKSGITREQIIAAFAAMHPAATYPDHERPEQPQTQPQSQPQPQHESPTADAQALHSQILDRLRVDLELNNSSIALVADVRRSLDFQNLGKTEFDEAVLELRRRQEIELGSHDSSAELSAEKREELVRDRDGNYFNTISFRKQH